MTGSVLPSVNIKTSKIQGDCAPGLISAASNFARVNMNHEGQPDYRPSKPDAKKRAANESRLIKSNREASNRVENHSGNP
jgi:hypothetical protein